MNLTEQEKKFLKHFIGGLGGITTQVTTAKVLDEYKQYGEVDNFNELNELLMVKYPLDYLNSIYLKLSDSQ